MPPLNRRGLALGGRFAVEGCLALRRAEAAGVAWTNKFACIKFKVELHCSSSPRSLEAKAQYTMDDMICI